MIQTVAIMAVVGSALIVLVALFVISRSRVAVPDGNKVVYRARRYYAIGLSLVLLVALGMTMGQTPYNAYANEPAAAEVSVVGRMWSWQMSVAGEKEGQPIVLPAGKVIDFAVDAVDVNHGFGIYDEAGRLLGQTQAMPGYTNHLRMVFEPGHYRVLCMEYCGLIHHMMFTEFAVQ